MAADTPELLTSAEEEADTQEQVVAVAYNKLAAVLPARRLPFYGDSTQAPAPLLVAVSDSHEKPCTENMQYHSAAGLLLLKLFQSRPR